MGARLVWSLDLGRAIVEVSGLEGVIDVACSWLLGSCFPFSLW